MEIIVKKIEETTDIDKVFIVQCCKYLGKTDMIPYSEVCDLIGYKQKRSIQEILDNKKYDFVDNTDYKIVKEKKEGVCKPVNEIYMTMDTIKCICMMAPTKKSQEFRRYYLQLEKVFLEIATTEILNKVTNPIPKFNAYILDIAKYKGKVVVYLIELPELGEYKYGMTHEIIDRLTSHAKTFKYTGVIKIWDCSNGTVAMQVEDSIKSYTHYNKMNIKRGSMVELFKTDDISKIIKVTDQYVEKFTKDHYSQFIDKKLEQENEIIKNKLEHAKVVAAMIDKLGLDKNSIKAYLSNLPQCDNATNNTNTVNTANSNNTIDVTNNEHSDDQDEKPKKIKKPRQEKQISNKIIDDIL